MNHLTDSTPAAGDTESQRVERFQSLQTGQYWRAIDRVPEMGIDAGEVLLLVSIRLVDDKPHTIVLRPHPSKFGVDVEVEREDDDGKVRKHLWSFEEYSFLLADFLAAFTHEPKAAEVRAREVQGVHARVAQLEQELVSLQKSPQAMATRVQQLLEDQNKTQGKKAIPSAGGPAGAAEGALVDPAQGWLETATQGVVALSQGTLGDAIAAELTVEDVARLRVAAEHQYTLAKARADVIQAQTMAISQTISSLTPYYLEQAAAALAQTEDVQVYVAKLIAGIQSLDLYVGKGVEVVTIRKGASAPADVPLSFAQRKLFMDEELAIYANVDERFDFQSVDKFFKALRQEPGLVDQVFPTARCALVMATTRRDVEYGSGWANRAGNDENRRVFLLVRDGESLYQVFSPVTSHIGAARLFPTHAEQGEIFRGWDGSRVRFDDVTFTDKKADHDRMALHYKRFLILACGLDHRLNLFGTFYPGPKGLDFVSMAFQDAHCHFIYHDEPALPEAVRPSFDEWIRQKNTHLRSGSRVLCSWPDAMNPDTAPGACKAYSGDEMHFDRRYEPTEPFGMRIAYKDGNDLCVDVVVEGQTRGNNTNRSFTCKVALNRFRSGYFRSLDDINLPFLVLDAVEIDELDWYIRSREARKSHLVFIRFFKLARQHIAAERQAEADTRARMVQALLDGGITESSASAEPLVNEAVRSWRASNRGAALPAFDGEQPPAGWTALLDQMFARAREDGSIAEQAHKLASKLGLEPLRLVVTGRGRFALYAEAAAQERDDRVEPFIWVHRITLERSAKGLRESSRRWTVLPSSDASESVQHQWPAAERWIGLRAAFKSPSHKAECFARCDRFREVAAPYLAGKNEANFSSLLRLWRSMRMEMTKRSPVVREPEILIPIGLLTTNGHHARFLCMATTLSHRAIQDVAASPAQLAALRGAFIELFADKEYGASQFDRPRREHPWTLMTCEIWLDEEHGGLASHTDESQGLQGASDYLELAPLCEAWKAERRESGGGFWITPHALGEDGRLELDELLGITLPVDHDPCYLVSYTLGDKASGGPQLAWDILLVSKMPRGADEPSTPFPRITDEMESELLGPLRQKPFGYGQSKFFSPGAARNAIASAAQRAGGRAVLASEQPDLPQPPAWAERWYFTV